jgi:hypothetical protein
MHINVGHVFRNTQDFLIDIGTKSCAFLRIPKVQVWVHARYPCAALMLPVYLHDRQVITPLFPRMKPSTTFTVVHGTTRESTVVHRMKEARHTTKPSLRHTSLPQDSSDQKAAKTRHGLRTLSRTVETKRNVAMLTDTRHTDAAHWWQTIISVLYHMQVPFSMIQMALKCVP